MDVANEYIQLKNSMNAKLRHITKQSEHSEAISKARLGKLKTSKENKTKLRETLETTTDTFEQHLSMAHAEIERLTDPSSGARGTSCECSASHQILCTSAHITFVTAETKTTCDSKERRSMG